MTTHHFHKADPLFKDDLVEDLILKFDLPIPEAARDYKKFAVLETLYAVDARKIAELLAKTLPGGLLDQLIATLFLMRSTKFAVSLFSEEK